MNIGLGKVVGVGLSALLGVIVMAVLNAFILGLIVMLLWNWLVPAVVPALPASHQITYWQGWGICFLLRLLVPSK
jgi:hypothetical protein